MNDGKLNMIKLADAAKDEAIVQTPATGLVGMPTQTQYGANFKLLLNPAVHMWSLVQLKNSEIAEAQVTPGQAQMPLDKEWIYQVIALTLPIQAGDECLVVFGDMCIDGWWQSGGVQNQVECRRHDLSDGFAIIGVWSQPRVFSEYSTNSAQLRNEAGNAYVEISGGVINIVGDVVNIQAGTVNIN